MFTFVMDIFSKIISKAVKGGLVSGFTVEVWSGVPVVVLHLLFADDTIIFFEALAPQLLHLHAFLCAVRLKG